MFSIAIYYDHMILTNTIQDVLIGGVFSGNSSWGRQASDWDKCFKLYYVTDGELVIKDSRASYVLDNNKLYFICGFHLTAYSAEDSFSVDWLHFLLNSIYICHTLSKLPTVVELNTSRYGFLLDSLKNIDRIMPPCPDQQTDHSHAEYLRLQALLQMIIADVIEQFQLNIAGEDYNVRRLKPALDLITGHYTSSIRLEDLAACCHLSPNHFHSLFSKIFSTTPHAYIMRLKMNEATALIINSELTMKEIAFRLGFLNDTYFSHAFKKHYHMSPGCFRKKHQNSGLFREI